MLASFTLCSSAGIIKNKLDSIISSSAGFTYLVSMFVPPSQVPPVSIFSIIVCLSFCLFSCANLLAVNS